jgi:putative DNA primase/helicase
MSADAGQVKTQIESDAQNQIGVRAARLQSLPRDSLDESQARDSLRADLVDLDRIPRESRGRADAAAVLAANAATQASYGSALRERPPELVAEVDAAARSAEQASRNTIERGPEREAARPAPETIVLDAAVRERLAGLRARDRETVGRPESNSPGNDGQVSERFITALDKRMEKSELEELGWKGRDDLNDVMRDLRKLASVDFQRASDLWSKYRPDDKDKPPFLDDDELSEARRRTTRGAAKENEPAKEFVPPEHLRKRFLQVDDKYYFRHEDNKLAFRDHGNRIATQHDDAVVALSMIQLAEAKGWQTVNLKGSNEFKREAWLQASLKGMEVRGYSPRDVDIEKLAELQKELGPNPKTPTTVVERTARVVAEREARNRPEELPEKTAVVDEQRRTLSEPQRVVIDTIQTVLRQRGDSERAVSVAAAIAAEKFQNNRVYVGKVLEKGEAPYENDSKNEKSYYVKLQTPKGEKTVWGVDLKRSLEEGNIKVGDEVAIANQGKQQVTVQVKSRDAATNEVRQSSIVTNRNVWDVRNIESLREEAREKLQTAAERSDKAPLIKVYDRAAQSEIVRPQVKIEPTRDSERSR